jgi:hypothetical protein
MPTLDEFRPEFQVEAGQPIPRRYATQRGTGAEAQEVRRRLGDFNANQSSINLLLETCFPGATKSELISVAQMTMVVASERYPDAVQLVGEFDRVTRRSKDLIVKWYHDNWMILKTIFPDIGLADRDFRSISTQSSFT